MLNRGLDKNNYKEFNNGFNVKKNVLQKIIYCDFTMNKIPAHFQYTILLRLLSNIFIKKTRGACSKTHIAPNHFFALDK